jgi:hypothetical protein
MENKTKVFSWGYYEYIVDLIISREREKQINPGDPLSSGFSKEIEEGCKVSLLEMCREFDSFFIEDFYSFEETEKILMDRLTTAVKYFRERK